MKKNNYIILGGLILASASVLALNFYLGKSHKTLVSNDDLIITKPKKLFASKVVFLWGGLHFADPQWMLSQIPNTILNKYTFLIVPYNTSLSSVKSSYKAEFNKDVKEKNLMLVGFSAGAKIPQQVYSNDFELVGLIDPSTDSQLAKKSYGENTVLTYNLPNWSGLPSIYKQLPILRESVVSSGGKAIELKLSHKKFVKYFFENLK